MRHLLKPHLRILMFTLTIATFVTLADLFLKAFVPDMSAALGPYVPLIIVNCIIICRAEACASKNGLLISIVDALGMGLGFTVALCVLAGIRELLSTGKVFDMTVLPTPEAGGWFVPWAAMSMPVGAFITLGLLLGLVNLISHKKA
jgi:electron transport complex protein RnfE